MQDHASKLARLLTRAEVEAEYGIGKRYLEVAVTRREGPAYVKIGRSVRYRRVDIEAWILDQRVETGDAGMRSA